MLHSNRQNNSAREPHSSPELEEIEKLVEKISAEGARAETLVNAEPERIARIIALLAPARKHAAKSFKVGVRRYGEHPDGPSLGDIDRSRPIQTEATRILYDMLGTRDDDIREQGT